MARTKLNLDCYITDHCAISVPTPEIPPKYLEWSCRVREESRLYSKAAVEGKTRTDTRKPA